MAANLTYAHDQQCFNDPLYFQNAPTIKLRFSISTTILIYCIYLLPFCFGVFGNFSVCLIFFQQRKLRSITNTFLMNLCINDLIVLCVSIPMTLSAALVEHWVFGAFLCKLVNFTPTLTALVSTFTVAIISVERWFFIVNKRKFHRCCTLLTLLLLWFVSILIAMPEFISRHLEEFAPQAMTYPMMSTSPSSNTIDTDSIQQPPPFILKPPCNMKKVYFCVLNPGLPMRIFSYIVITVQYLVPFLFVSISCYSISRFLKGRMKQMRIYQIRQPKGTTHDMNSLEMKNNTDGNHSPDKHLESKRRNYGSNCDEFTELQFDSNEDLPTIVDAYETKSQNLLGRIRHTFQTNEQHQMPTSAFRKSHRTDTNAVIVPRVRNQSHSERRFHRSRKLLICVAVLFTISWLPLTIVQIYLEHNEEIARDEPYFVYAFLLVPCYLISSISAWMNPVIYNYINHSFRREFYALYPCFFKVTAPPETLSPRTTFAQSSLGKRLRTNALQSIEENFNDASSPLTNKSVARLVTFVDGNTERKSTVATN